LLALATDNIDALPWVGVIYGEGLGVAKDDAEAVRWYQKAADQGNNAGQNNLGEMYQLGRGVAKDDAEAVRWYRKAADQGLAEAQYYLAWMLERGRGTAKSVADATRWYRRAAAQGHAKARAALKRLGDAKSPRMSSVYRLGGLRLELHGLPSRRDGSCSPSCQRALKTSHRWALENQPL
jgi:TPR repeat protein